MKGNFNSPNSVIPLSGIHGNMVGQRHEKLPKLLLRYIASCKTVLAIVTLSGIYAPLATICTILEQYLRILWVTMPICVQT